MGFFFVKEICNIFKLKNILILNNINKGRSLGDPSAKLHEDPTIIWML